MIIYKVCGKSAWQSAVQVGQFCGAAIDLRDGFIHFSAGHQVRETVAKHFAGESDLVLVAVDDQLLGDALKWEVSRGGDEFPHLYGNLDVTLARSVHDLSPGDDGAHVFPVLDNTDS
jgi:uncharacterized protein (DUF952 family)